MPLRLHPDPRTLHSAVTLRTRALRAVALSALVPLLQACMGDATFVVGPTPTHGGEGTWLGVAAGVAIQLEVSPATELIWVGTATLTRGADSRSVAITGYEADEHQRVSLLLRRDGVVYASIEARYEGSQRLKGLIRGEPSTGDGAVFGPHDVPVVLTRQ